MKFVKLAVKTLSLLTILVALCLAKDDYAAAIAKEPGNTVTVQADFAKTTHRMAGGIGASWHAISREFTIKPQDMHGWKDTLNSRGSAWGGNPPIQWADTWKQICTYASRLGMNWIRVEFSQRMYEQQRDHFDWTNEEMQALYRILDWCEKNNVDVFLTQMWAFVDWNSFEGVHPLQSAPKSVEDFAESLATAVEYLVKKRKYTCIRWLCIVNEPNLRIGWWLGPDRKPKTIMPALKAVRAALDRRNITVPLSAPDWNHLGIGPRDIFDIDADIEIGAFDAHNYGGPQPDKIAQMADWVKRARERGIPFFLSEMGDMRLGWKHSHTGPKSYLAALSNTETILRGISLGVDAFNRWSFTNRGDLDGQWQMLRTWDMDRKQYLREVIPEPVPYYCCAILTRFCAKYSQVIETQVLGNPEVVAAALRSPKGEMTLYVLNKGLNEQDLTLVLRNLGKPCTFYSYQVTESKVKHSGFKLNPQRKLDFSSEEFSFKDRLPPQSITTFSTYKLSHSDLGIISE